MRYIPDSSEEEMLKEMNFTREKLFSDIPKDLRSDLKLWNEKSEIEVKKEMKRILDKNKIMLNFLGAGVYNHYIPSVVKEIMRRNEFYTSYTPYQAEVSQGMLQALFEYQSLMAEVLDMDVVNCSMYDWATSLAEAALMCYRVKKKPRFIISKNIHPERKKVLETYTEDILEIVEIGYDENGIDLEDLKKNIDNCCGVYIENPTFLGYFEQNLEEIEEIVHKNDALIVAGVDPISLGIIKPPGEYADIAIGESVGYPMSFGGPLLGIFGVKNDMNLIRKMPGRLIGATEDLDGNLGFVMTLQTREQHIRREKATSNICSNEALCAVASAVYLAFLGKKGLKEIGELCMKNANYTMRRINEIKGFKAPLFNSLHFKEFTVHHENMKEIDKKLLENNIQGGVILDRIGFDLKDTALYCVTEMHTKEDIDKLISVLEAI
ncbi:MAG: aminomethyl-transferring glycine dehydrogenase subunit GcvPA [Methanomicrobia archaeon]|nr:aminomethyl-transferring glycine dehydrogenase subunit GcvPA [Methanomicrobia archaeon]